MPEKTKAAATRNTKTVPARPRKTAASKKKQEKNGNTAIDFCGAKLTALQRLFLIHYITPGTPTFHNALQAAIKAGYKETAAKSNIYIFLQKPDIQNIIRKNESLAHRALHEAAMRAMELKQRRAFFDPADYFEEREITIEGKEGSYTKPGIALKSLENMTPEQRMCIDGIDIKGQAAVPVYIMADRSRELNDIIKIDNELSKSAADTGEEETREIIMERITIRETKRAERPADTEYEIVDRPGPDAEEEEEDEE
ncbi:MAG: terminase small subunit [Spirochaetaceae bacterium]|jgi:phage terminase small subunit|nr:terminase small subunit [Spirochaetaceae bacterium]